jgi:hypothetical protein
MMQVQTPCFSDGARAVKRVVTGAWQGLAAAVPAVLCDQRQVMDRMAAVAPHIPHCCQTGALLLGQQLWSLKMHAEFDLPGVCMGGQTWCGYGGFPGGCRSVRGAAMCADCCMGFQRVPASFVPACLCTGTEAGRGCWLGPCAMACPAPEVAYESCGVDSDACA